MENLYKNFIKIDIMSNLNLENIVGFKAVDKDGNEQNVTVDEMVDMVSTRMVMALSETSTFAAAAATGNDVYENELPTVTDAANVRVLQSSGDAAKMTMQSLASKLGELTLPKYNSNELNYGDLNNFKSLTIRPINRWTNPDFPKTNWPDGMTDGTFIVETFNGIVRQTAISKMLCIRFFFDQTNMWTEWKEY